MKNKTKKLKDQFFLPTSPMTKSKWKIMVAADGKLYYFDSKGIKIEFEQVEPL